MVTQPISRYATGNPPVGSCASCDALLRTPANQDGAPCVVEVFRTPNPKRAKQEFLCAPCGGYTRFTEVWIGEANLDEFPMGTLRLRLDEQTYLIMERA